MIRQLTSMAALTTAITLSACSVLPESEPPRIVSLAASADQPTYQTPRAVSLRVDTPLASAPFDTNLVLIQPQNWEFQALPDTRWRDSMPVVVRDQLVQSFRNSNGFDNILVSSSAAHAEWTLLSELNGFHARKTGRQTTVAIQLHYELMNNRSRKTLCVLEEKREVSAENGQLASLMSAFSLAAAAISEKTVSWAYDCLGDVSAPAD